MVKLLVQILVRFALHIIPEGRFPSCNRYLLRAMGVNIGRKVKIYSSIRVSRGLNISVGDYTFIGSRSVFVGGVDSSVSIGSYCDISDNVHFVTGTHEIDPKGRRTAGRGYAKDIIVEDGVWIGYNALILPGVTIGEKAIVAAGTVVHKNVAPNAVVGGNPMIQIRFLNNHEETT